VLRGDREGKESPVKTGGEKHGSGLMGWCDPGCFHHCCFWGTCSANKGVTTLAGRLLPKE